MRHLIALAVCAAGMLTCGTEECEAQFYGYYPSYTSYYAGSNCCYRPYTSYYVPRVSYYVSAYSGCCPTTACYRPCCPTTCCQPVTNCCPNNCGSNCTTGACGVGCATSPAPVTAALPVPPNRPVKMHTRTRILAPVRTTEFVSTEKPVESKPLVRRATLRTASKQQQAPSTGWEAIN